MTKDLPAGRRSSHPCQGSLCTALGICRTQSSGPCLVSSDMRFQLLTCRYLVLGLRCPISEPGAVLSGSCLPSWRHGIVVSGPEA